MHGFFLQEAVCLLGGNINYFRLPEIFLRRVGPSPKTIWVSEVTSHQLHVPLPYFLRSFSNRAISCSAALFSSASGRRNVMIKLQGSPASAALTVKSASRAFDNSHRKRRVLKIFFNLLNILAPFRSYRKYASGAKKILANCFCHTLEIFQGGSLIFQFYIQK